MSRLDDCKVLAAGCAYYKEKYEKLAKENIELKSSLHQAKTNGVAVVNVSGEKVTETEEFKAIQAKTKEFVEATNKEKEQLGQESSVLLKSMTKLSAELQQVTEANSNLASENDALKARINTLMAEQMKEQKEAYSKLLEDKDTNADARLALEQNNTLIKNLQSEIEELKKLEKYKKLYEDEHAKVISLESELDVLRRSANTSSVVSDEVDDSFLMN